MARNQRIFYACQAVAITNHGDASIEDKAGTDMVYGLQSVGMTTNFNLEQAFELGQIEIYENKIDSATVKWVNECEFILTKINPKSNQDKRPVKIEILSTQDKEYFFEYSLVNNPEKRFRGKAIKVN